MPDRSRNRTDSEHAQGAWVAPKPAPSQQRNEHVVRPKIAAAVELGRLGGLKGGKARAAKLTPERRTEIAKAAAAARWKK